MDKTAQWVTQETTEQRPTALTQTPGKPLEWTVLTAERWATKHQTTPGWSQTVPFRRLSWSQKGFLGFALAGPAFLGQTPYLAAIAQQASNQLLKLPYIRGSNWFCPLFSVHQEGMAKTLQGRFTTVLGGRSGQSTLHPTKEALRSGQSLPWVPSSYFYC